MIQKLIVAVLTVAGFLAGAYGGDLLRPQPEPGEITDSNQPAANTDAQAEKETTAPVAEPAWFRIPNQFFIPILRNDTVRGVMVLTLTVETTEPQLAAVQQQEHRLRDALLGTLMIHANTGGFEGNFTTEVHLSALRKALLTAAQKVSGPEIINILIEDIARQDQ